MLFLFPFLLPHVFDLVRLHSSSRATAVHPRLPQRVHGPLQRHHELLQHPQRLNISKAPNSSHHFSTNSRDRPPPWRTSSIEPLTFTTSFTSFCISSSSLLKHQPRRRAAAASWRCCIINHEGYDLETSSTALFNVSSTPRDLSTLASTSTPSTSCCSLQSLQPHPTTKGFETERSYPACEFIFYYSSQWYSF